MIKNEYMKLSRDASHRRVKSDQDVLDAGIDNSSMDEDSKKVPVYQYDNAAICGNTGLSSVGYIGSSCSVKAALDILSQTPRLLGSFKCPRECEFCKFLGGSWLSGSVAVLCGHLSVKKDSTWQDQSPRMCVFALV